jgi:hypothetical protein
MAYESLLSMYRPPQPVEGRPRRDQLRGGRQPPDHLVGEVWDRIAGRQPGHGGPVPAR